MDLIRECFAGAYSVQVLVVISLISPVEGCLSRAPLFGLNARIGSIDAARRAGMNLAIRAPAISSGVALIRTTASFTLGLVELARDKVSADTA